MWTLDIRQSDCACGTEVVLVAIRFDGQGVEYRLIHVLPTVTC